MLLHESETIELKEMVVDDIKKEIVAFANCEGGKLYIGVRDDALWWGLKIQMVLHFRSVIWSEMQLSRILRCFCIMKP